MHLDNDNSRLRKYVIVFKKKLRKKCYINQNELFLYHNFYMDFSK